MTYRKTYISYLFLSRSSLTIIEAEILVAIDGSRACVFEKRLSGSSYQVQN